MNCLKVHSSSNSTVCQLLQTNWQRWEEWFRNSQKQYDLVKPYSIKAVEFDLKSPRVTVASVRRLSTRVRRLIKETEGQREISQTLRSPWGSGSLGVRTKPTDASKSTSSPASAVHQSSWESIFKMQRVVEVQQGLLNQNLRGHGLAFGVCFQVPRALSCPVALRATVLHRLLPGGC